MLQYKVLHNILYADKMLFKFENGTSTRCSFCKSNDEKNYAPFMPYILWQGKSNVVNMSCDLTRPHEKSVTLLIT